MAIDFPNSPALNDIFTVGLTSWKWTGTAWSVVRSTTGPSGPTGPQGPSGPAGATGPSGPTGPAGVATAYSNGTDTSNLNKIFYNNTGTPPSGSSTGDLYIYY